MALWYECILKDCFLGGGDRFCSGGLVLWCRIAIIVSLGIQGNSRITDADGA